MPLPPDARLYEDARDATRALLLPGLADKDSPYHPANATRLGIHAVRPSVRQLDGQATSVVLVTVSATRYADPDAPDLDPTIPPALAAGGVRAVEAPVRLLIERAGAVERIEPLAPQAQQPPRAAGRTCPGDPVATIVTDLSDAKRLISVGGTLGGAVLYDGRRDAQALMSCSHCIAVTDAPSPPTPDKGDLVLAAPPWDRVFIKSDPTADAVATLDRWTALCDPVDAATALLRPRQTVDARPDEPYLWPAEDAAPRFRESAWFFGAGSGRRCCGIVESTDAVAYVTNADGTTTAYRGLATLGRETGRGWRPVSTGGDSGAWSLGWRDGRVAALGVLCLVGTPRNAPIAHAFTFMAPMPQVLRELEKERTHVSRHNRPQTIRRLQTVTIDPIHARFGLPPPPWLDQCEEYAAPTPHEEFTVNKDGCIVYNFHFHATAQCGAASHPPKEEAADPTTRTGFTNFSRFRVTLGDVNTGSARKVTAVRVKAERQGLPTLSWTSMPSPPLPLSPKQAAALYLNGGYPDTVIMEVTEEIAVGTTSRVTEVQVTIPAGVDPQENFLGEVDLELVGDDPNNWKVHVSFGQLQGTPQANRRRANATRVVSIKP